MKIKNAKKIGFFAALTMLIGTVVGIGIFFKNGSISRATNGEGITWLMAWIIGGIIAGATAISFSEIGTLKTKSKSIGLPGWSEDIVGEKFGKFVRFNYAFFYIAGLTAILGIFGSEMLLQPIIASGAIKQIPIYGHLIIGLLITVIMIAINYISIKTSGIIQQITTILKFIPLILAVILGIVLPTTNHMGGSNAFLNNSFTFKGLIVALPAILFAYDAFMIVASLTNKVEKGEKKVPIIIVLGMSSIIILYTLIALSSILHNSGSIQGLINNVLPKSSADAMTTTIYTFILISTLGVINGLTAGMIVVFKNEVENDTFVGTKKLKEKIGKEKTTILYIAISCLFWILITGIPSAIIGQDYLYDGFSNFPTLFFFGINSIIITFYLFKRKKFNNKKINNIMFFSSAIIAVTGTAIAIIYLLIGHYIIDVAKTPHANSSWGLFASTKPASFLTEIAIFLTMLSIFLITPAINWGIKGLQDKNAKRLKIDSKNTK
ncbi:APC family permease [Mycoplasma marinum]|uniref:Amino acid permease n=1 Tax=Mycoplasma marinum TaxID=1937190 RepID=A0A4R0XL83_9MOLU|nr:amino acid permease [Mycoplasma marinum]TCG11224.1 hypothetical protein C4B24_02585 [Mycoplasma marinum]